MPRYKNLTVKIQLDRHDDLLLIQDYYSEKVGVKLNQTQTLEKILFETANKIKNAEKTQNGEPSEWLY